LSAASSEKGIYAFTHNDSRAYKLAIELIEHFIKDLLDIDEKVEQLKAKKEYRLTNSEDDEYED
jgi:hypothetical protein